MSETFRTERLSDIVDIIDNHKTTSIIYHGKQFDLVKYGHWEIVDETEPTPDPEPQPEPTPDPNPEPEPIPTPQPQPIPLPEPEPEPESTKAEPMIVVTPVEEPEIVEEEVIEEEVIVEEELPLVGMMGHWAVINLVLSILAALFIIVRTHKKNVIAKVLVIILSALVFLFTEDWTLPMVWFDKWTLVHFGLTWVQLLLCRKEEEKEEDEGEEE